MTLLAVIITAGVTFSLGLIGYAYTIFKDRQAKPGQDIDRAIAQWKEILGGSVQELRQTVQEQREENARLAAINESQRETLEEQRQQIDKLENDIEQLELLVRSLTTQNMEVAHEAQRVRHQLEELIATHNQLIGRMQQRGDDAATG
jgi:methyl-accepting chemotaxis protein